MGYHHFLQKGMPGNLLILSMFTLVPFYLLHVLAEKAPAGKLSTASQRPPPRVALAAEVGGHEHW